MPGGSIFRLQQAGREADAGPTADAGENADVLLAAVLIGHDVADDAGRRLELVKLLAGLCVDRLQITFKRAVEDHATGCRQGTAPSRELLLVRPDNLSGLVIPGDEIT